MARLVLGVGVSALFVALTLARVDLAAVADALRAAAPLGVLAAFAIVLLDFGIRTIRWKLLLDGLEGRPPTVGLRTVAAYLSIGYLGNASLPARLGDLARAYLAGLAFGISRATILGTIVVERVADGATMLGLAVFSSLLVNVGEVRALAAAATGLAIVAVAALGAILLVVSRGNLARWRHLRLVRDAAGRLAAGIAGVRTIRGATRVGGVTVAAAATAVWLGWVVAGAAGIALT
ncbi:MAG: lysylphosphatidylglycerol synthase domain-containing protein, partial [Chloroflexota bacterium]